MLNTCAENPHGCFWEETLNDAAAIPVDLLRGDYISAGLDAFGILPFDYKIID